MLRLLIAAAIGTLAGAGIVLYVGPPGAGVGIAGVAFSVLIIAVVLTAVGRSMATTVSATKEDITQAIDSRRIGVARIDAIRQTGTQINDQPLCELDLTVQPLSGQAYATTVSNIVPVTDIPSFQAGVFRDVAILIEGGPEIAFIGGGEFSEHERARISVPPRSNVPMIPIEPHTRIVKGRRKGPLVGLGKKGRLARFSMFAIIAIVAALVVTWPYRTAVTQTAHALQQGQWHVDLRQPDALAVAQEALQDEIGHDQVISVYVSADFVIVEAPLEADGVKSDEWEYRGGRVANDGPATIQPESADEAFSWSDVAFDRLWPLMLTASGDSDLPVGDSGASIVRSTNTDINSENFAEPVGPPQIGFSLEDDYSSASFTAEADGSKLVAQ
ncbi:hypothetical protein [Brevibacterium oceani]|uniref:hypothetical protein n=1 Tax=Brevibacterium oceani TaxID=358099 RepID=UPI0015E7D952|nr:hypothetical protein [Brevibacterium oceani]